MMTRAQFISIIAAIPFVGKLVKPSPTVTSTALVPIRHYIAGYTPDHWLIIGRNNQTEEPTVVHHSYYGMGHNEDWTVFTNVDGSFSKDVIKDGPITDIELQKYFKVTGPYSHIPFSDITDL